MSPLHWLIVLAVVLILFGGGSKISALMGDFAKGIKSFKKHMAEDESLEEHAASTTMKRHIQAHELPNVASDERVAPHREDQVPIMPPKAPPSDSSS